MSKTDGKAAAEDDDDTLRPGSTKILGRAFPKNAAEANDALHHIEWMNIMCFSCSEALEHLFVSLFLHLLLL